MRRTFEDQRLFIPVAFGGRSQQGCKLARVFGSERQRVLRHPRPRPARCALYLTLSPTTTRFAPLVNPCKSRPKRKNPATSRLRGSLLTGRCGSFAPRTEAPRTQLFSNHSLRPPNAILAGMGKITQSHKLLKINEFSQILWVNSFLAKPKRCQPDNLESAAGADHAQKMSSMKRNFEPAGLQARERKAGENQTSVGMSCFMLNPVFAPSSWRDTGAWGHRSMEQIRI